MKEQLSALTLVAAFGAGPQVPPCTPVPADAFREVLGVSLPEGKPWLAGQKGALAYVTFAQSDARVLWFEKGKLASQETLKAPPELGNAPWQKPVVGEMGYIVLPKISKAAVYAHGQLLGVVSFPPLAAYYFAALADERVFWSFVRPFVSRQLSAEELSKALGRTVELEKTKMTPVEESPVLVAVSRLDRLEPEPVLRAQPPGPQDPQEEGLLGLRLVKDPLVYYLPRRDGKAWTFWAVSGNTELRRAGKVVRTWAWPLPSFSLRMENPTAVAERERERRALEEAARAEAELEAMGDATKFRTPEKPPAVWLGDVSIRAGVVGLRDEDLVVALTAVEEPARALLVFREDGQPMCYTLPMLAARSFSRRALAINDTGVWLAEPLGYFPWEAFPGGGTSPGQRRP
ncbi:MAG: hypothetical protein ACP5NF_11365 [Thermoanaerobaculum sp.]